MSVYQFPAMVHQSKTAFPQPKCFMLKSPMFHIENIPHMENMVCPINELFQHYRLRCSGLMILCDIM